MTKNTIKVVSLPYSFGGGAYTRLEFTTIQENPDDPKTRACAWSLVGPHGRRRSLTVAEAQDFCMDLFFKTASES